MKNLELTGAPNFYVTSEEPAKLVKSFPEFFDKILIDAPCSGEGMFHKEPKMAEYWLRNHRLLCRNSKGADCAGSADVKAGRENALFYLYVFQKGE